MNFFTEIYVSTTMVHFAAVVPKLQKKRKTGKQDI